MAETAVVVGIDVSKARLDVACSDRAEAWSVENTAAGVSALVPRLQALRPALVVLEATGGYERAAVASLAAVGLPAECSTVANRRLTFAKPAQSEGCAVPSANFPSKHTAARRRLERAASCRPKC